MENAGVVKIDEELRLVFGWANVTVMADEEVVDLQDDTMDTQVLVKSFMEFMSASRTGGHMHSRDDNKSPISIGEVVFAFPMTPDIKKSFGIDIPQEGVIIGVRVDDDQVWKDVKDGKLPAFSIGGKATRVPVAEAA